jgi:transposase-like protein
MPVGKEYTAEFKQQAVRFTLEEIELDGSRRQACDRVCRVGSGQQRRHLVGDEVEVVEIVQVEHLQVDALGTGCVPAP